MDIPVMTSKHSKNRETFSLDFLEKKKKQQTAAPKKHHPHSPCPPPPENLHVS